MNRRYSYRILSLIILCILLFIGCSSQKFSVYKNSENKTIISGKISWDEWCENAGWEAYKPQNWKPDYEKLNILTQLTKNSNLKFMIFSGAWCDDSKTEVPKIMYIFNNISFDLHRIEIYGLNKEKHDLTGTSDKFQILKVPTLVILNSEKEIGRVVEFPQKSWEDDIIHILQKK